MSQTHQNLEPVSQVSCCKNEAANHSPTASTTAAAANKTTNTTGTANAQVLHAELLSYKKPECGMTYAKERGFGALAEKMGIVPVEFTREKAVATMPVAGNTQPIGLLHGGAYVVLAETLGSMHANFLAPAGFVAVGVDINATHTASPTSGSVTGVCTPVHIGRSLAVHEIVITRDTDGKRCSTVRITNFYKQLPQQPASTQQ